MRTFKIPPFSKPLYDLQKSGYSPNNSIYLFIGNKAWAKGQAFSKMYPTRTMIIPPWLPPIDYHWPVNECDILIIDTGYAEKSYVEELALCLYAGNAEIVRSINFINPMVVYHKG